MSAQKLGGLAPGEVTVLAANPSMGKSAFASEIVRKNAKAKVKAVKVAVMRHSTITIGKAPRR